MSIVENQPDSVPHSHGEDSEGVRATGAQPTTFPTSDILPGHGKINFERPQRPQYRRDTHPRQDSDIANGDGESPTGIQSTPVLPPPVNQTIKGIFYNLSVSFVLSSEPVRKINGTTRSSIRRNPRRTMSSMIIHAPGTCTTTRQRYSIKKWLATWLVVWISCSSL